MRSTTVLLAAFVIALLATTASELYRRPLNRYHLSTSDPGCRVDLNRADAPTLSLLPGVGPALAGRIIQDRQDQGPFRTAADLRRVKGFGPVHLEAVRPFVVCGQP